MPQGVILGETPALFFNRLCHSEQSGEACLQCTRNLSGLSEHVMTNHTHAYKCTAAEKPVYLVKKNPDLCRKVSRGICILAKSTKGQ